VVVAVVTNDMKNYVATAKSKEYMFSMEQRTAMAAAACADLPNVRVISSTARLIDLVDELGADIIVKGVRNAQDYEYEQHHALYNRAHNERAETLYLPADPQFDGISSTLVRERLAKGEAVDDLVPPAVAELIAKR
ncbi:MAG: pantetheine-phosphate adenylyltransferase, partial [Clostridia bacterium]|nr:pantetheine-phosphate adenylyltransferase [Clostridia bacterium]